MPPRTRGLVETVLGGVALAGATASGALLFSLTQAGRGSLPELVVTIGVPGTLALVAAVVLARVTTGPRLVHAVLLGAGAGTAGTVALEVIRITGFRAFDSMPGDIAMLMGVLLLDRIMEGPSTASNLAGWGYHLWNGAMFGVTYAVTVGGFPRSRRSSYGGALLGAAYGALLGTGFLAGPVPHSLGAGVFGVDFGPQFAVTVYLAHLAFGAVTGWLVHRYGTSITPLWEEAATGAGLGSRADPR
ncbi:hypothetical protein RIF23_16340 [Lipingzhangella sp. LS1_29]|uniref:Uncharacterized protein n=1 Tax=Lipingzhangella rawalii TaxID=2055835 RepID=A0ABU2H9C1_9ACTN|nr:hypothetical protein [Lipingzhangella rawalii]MDS1271863.1 hypothetical protein [Lipingzhangella rawalii]